MSKPSSLHAVHAVQTYNTFVLVPAVLSSILSFSEYFQLRPAVNIEPVLTDTPSFAETVNLWSSWNKKVNICDLIFDLVPVNKFSLFLKRVIEKNNISGVKSTILHYHDVY